MILSRDSPIPDLLAYPASVSVLASSFEILADNSRSLGGIITGTFFGGEEILAGGLATGSFAAGFAAGFAGAGAGVRFAGADVATAPRDITTLVGRQTLSASANPGPI